MGNTKIVIIKILIFEYINGIRKMLLHDFVKINVLINYFYVNITNQCQ